MLTGIFHYCPDFCEKSNRRRRLAGNLAPCSCAATVARGAGCLLSRTPRWACLIGNLCPPKLQRRRIVAKPDLPPQSIHQASHKAAPRQAGWSRPMQVWLKNHNSCDIFYKSQKCSFIPLSLGFHKIWDITNFSE